MFPEDLEGVFAKLNPLNSEWFESGAKPFIYVEVIDYNQNGEVTISYKLLRKFLFLLFIFTLNILKKNRLVKFRSASHYSSFNHFTRGMQIYSCYVI